MNKEVLEKKVAELLNIREEESQFAFSFFKEKVANFLNVGESIKIVNLGVFQLKEQLSHSGAEKSMDPNSKNLTLVFSPESGQSIEGSLFINLEIPDKTKDELEFDENVFQLGIGKPLVTYNENDSSIDDNSSKSTTEELEAEITSLLNNSEKLKDFDLWEDYLKSKETKSILTEDPNIDSNQELDKSDDDLKSIEKNLDEEDFVNLDENEIFNDIAEDSDLLAEDNLNNLTEELTVSKNEIDNSIQDFDAVNENYSMEDEESVEADNMKDDDLLDEESAEKSVIDEIDLELEKNSEDYNENIKEKETEETLEDQQSEELINSIEEDDYNVDDEDKKVEVPIEENLESVDQEEIKYKVTKKRKSPIIYLLIGSFILVGAIGIYYLFFKNSTLLYDKYELEVAQSEEHVRELEEAKINSKKDINETIVESEKENLEYTANVEPEKTNNSQTELSQINNSIQEENEVVDNIYFDGSLYYVQISSWKQEPIAEKEVNRLIKKGFPAFIFKIYIPKFKGTWHRVRVGPYNSLKEAQRAQTKIK